MVAPTIWIVSYKGELGTMENNILTIITRYVQGKGTIFKIGMDVTVPG